MVKRIGAALVLLLGPLAGLSSAIAIDATAFGDRSSPSTTISTSAFSTNAPNELLLAFISCDSLGATVQVNGVTGAGLTWVLVRRANGQLGTAEIWRAFAPAALANVTVTGTLSQSVAASITVVSFSGVDTSGTNGSGAIGAVASASAPTGAPTATLVTTRPNSWVFGVGVDWDNPTPRVLPSNQVLVHQYAATVGDMYWVQRQSAVTPLQGTSVTINDTAPTTDRWNLAICEILAASTTTYSLSGAISPSDLGSGALVTLSGGGNTQTATADTNGAYSFTGLPSGPYTITPGKSGVGFTPAQQTVTLTTDQTNVNFSAAPVAGNPIVVENARTGTTNWQWTNLAFNGEIEGYAGATSVNRGGSITLYVNSHSAPFTLDLYRMGWYQGRGARLVTSAGTLPGQTQAACPQDSTYGLTQCTWTPTTIVNVDPNWTSGVYLAKVRRTDTGKENYLTFVVRDDASTSDILFDSNVNTMQAYNAWGGKALYGGLSSPSQPARSISNAAVKVSFDRPYQAYDFFGSTNGEDTQFLRWEYQMVRWLESQGFDVSYSTNVDTALNGALLLHHRIYVLTGHGEYWTSSIRNSVEAAMGAGVSLAIFGANTGYWQVRYEASSSGVANRVMVGFKESAEPYDPLVNDPAQSTSRFRDSYIQRPENRFLGAMYGDNTGSADGFPFVVSNSAHPFYRNTGLANGNSMPGLVGDEWDNMNGQSTSNIPPNIPDLIMLSNSPTSGGNAHAVVHQEPSGALVFNASTFQWSWGLDNTLTPIAAVDSRIGQITANVLVDMGAMPLTPVGVTISSTFSTSGTISSLAGPATVTLSGPVNHQTTTDPQGNYVFKVLPNGTYTVTPTRSGASFTPASQSITISGASVAGINFTQASTAWSISGTIAPSSLGANTQVNLTGAATRSTNTDNAGAFSFGGLANGTYTVTPSKTGTVFTPASRNVTVSGGNVTGADFTAQAAPTYRIVGTITPSASGSGATLALSGAASGTATADSSGNYSFSGLPNGNYTVTPAKSGFAFSPPNQAVTLSGADGTANFTTQPATGIAIDATVFVDRSTKSTSLVRSGLSTTAGNELLLAFISADDLTANGQTVTGVTGGGLTWVLVRRTNSQRGTSEIWRAFAPAALTNVTITATLSQSVAAAMTVMSFKGVDTTGTNGSGAIGATASWSAASGAPTATLTTTRANSLVIGVGNDWDNGLERTVGSGQTMVHQYLATVGDTFWVQRVTNPVAASGTVVTINDTAPTGDRYNLTICEILAGG